MNIIIFGGGQLSYYLVDMLAGRRIVVASNSEPSWSSKNIYEFERLDIACQGDTWRVLDRYRPSCVINTAAISNIPASFQNIPKSFAVNTMGPTYIMDWIYQSRSATKFVQCSSIEMLEGSETRDEQSMRYSENPYGQSKWYAQNMVELYRGLGVKASSAILGNFESPLRSDKFVTGKIVRYVRGVINKEKLPLLQLGNIAANRSFMHAREAAEGILKILGNPKLGDWVLAGNNACSIEYFMERAFKLVGLDYKNYYVVDKNLVRKYEREWVATSSKLAQEELGWHPEMSLDQIIQDMINGI